MDNNNESSAAAQPFEFEDRKTGLTIFGILTILGGCLAGCMVPLMILGEGLSAKATGISPNYRTAIPGLVMYGGMAVAFIWLGIGSIMAQRWARALLLIFSSSWLALGVMMLPFMIYVFSNMGEMIKQSAPEGKPPPPGVGAVAMGIGLMFFGIFFVAIPAIWAGFYRSRHVKATCESRNPMLSWTDACPLPLLAVALWVGWAAPMMLMMPLTSNSVLPVFGTLISGLPGTIVFVVLAAVWAWIAWAFYKIDVRGWWVLVVLICLFALSHALTYANYEMAEVYRLMGYPEKQVAQMMKHNILTQNIMTWLIPVGMLPWLGYLIYVKRYFRAQTV
jgi:hypothetical protein